MKIKDIRKALAKYDDELDVDACFYGGASLILKDRTNLEAQEQFDTTLKDWANTYMV